MAGVKGRSGRKTRVSENSKAEVIMQSWDILKRFYADESISLYKRAEIASRLAGRDMQAPLVDQSTKNYVQIYRPEYYSNEDLEAASRPTDRSF